MGSYSGSSQPQKEVGDNLQEDAAHLYRRINANTGKIQAEAMKMPMMQIGASKDTIKEARAAINDILRATCYDKTKRSAFDCLARLCEVKDTTISHNSFTTST